MGERACPGHDVAMPDNLILKLSTWWHRDELDERLAWGADPDADAAISRRAAQLRSRTARVRSAEALENALREARKTWSVSARLPLRRVEVRQCADDVLALAHRLRDERPIDVQGAAMVSRLVFDGTSPLYREGRVSLRYVVRSARLALDPLSAPELALASTAAGA
jgi:hypothetical protein